VAATSKDAELAMLMVAEEARKRGIDRETTLCAQGGSEDNPPRAVAHGGDSNKGKGIQQEDEGVDERALGWERQLSTGDWWGAVDLAPVTLQPACATVASRAHTHALACFADGHPLVTSTAERAGFEGTPDWVDNTHRCVRVISSLRLVAPTRVLLDGGSFYSIAGLSLRSQLGLTAADMDAGGPQVHTATENIEALPGGLTKNPIPIILNKGDSSEVTLYERLAFTDFKGYDLLIGTRAAYPSGLLVDKWAERAVFRADWRGKGEVVGHLPMKLHQDRQAGWTVVKSKGRRQRHQVGVALACCLIN
jgi:hypothetical protein